MTKSRSARAGFAATLAILAIAAAPATAQVTCANASLVGSYGIALDGAAFPAAATAIGSPTFQKSIGLLTADGQGLLKATLTTSLNGTVTPTAYIGSYSVQANCTGSMTLNGGSSGPLALAFGIGNGGQSAVLAGTLASFVLSGTLAKAPTGCSTSGLTAEYNWETDGEVVQAGGAAMEALAEFIDLQFDGKGGISGGLVRAQPGASFTLPISGSYTVNGDCTGAIHFIDAQGSPYSIAFVQVDAGARMLVIQTDATTVNAGVAVSTGAANSSGSIAQVASAGNWTTTITLVNSGATPAQAQLNFFDQNGSPLPLPLTFPQTLSGVTIATTLSRTINPGATLQIVTTGPNSQPTQTGWAQLISSGNISGHAVFAQSVGSSLQEAVVSIETRNPTSVRAAVRQYLRAMTREWRSRTSRRRLRMCRSSFGTIRGRPCRQDADASGAGADFVQSGGPVFGGGEEVGDGRARPAGRRPDQRARPALQPDRRLQHGSTARRVTDVY